MSQINFVNSDNVSDKNICNLPVDDELISNSIAHEDRSTRYVVKRVIDVTCAVAGLIFFGPAMLFTALLIWQTRGPVLFRQERVGIRGEPFQCLKFRTMCQDADRVLQALLDSDPEAARQWQVSRKLKNDPRVTRFGRFLRKWSIDELPQLINVLRGEMSMVGPRPIMYSEIENYGEHFDLYASVSPGITGLWQASGRSNVSYKERVLMDVEYVTNWSLSGDLKIMLRTIPAVLGARGAV